jgi:hypothetical protein
MESKLGPLGTSATEWPIVPAPGDYDDGENLVEVFYWNVLSWIEFYIHITDRVVKS